MKKRNKRALILSVLSVALFLCGCLGKNRYIDEVTEDAIQIYGQEYLPKTDLPTEVTEAHSFKCEDGIQKIAELGQEISLFGIYEQGKDNEMSVLIAWGDIKQQFEWGYLATNGLSLAPYYFDVDYDGEKEIVAIIFTGGGTETSFSELHIVKLDSVKDCLIDYKMPQNLCEKVSKEIHVNILEDNIQFSVAGQKLSIPCDDTACYEDHIIMGNIVDYEILNEKVNAIYGVGVTHTERIVDYIASFSAEVQFCNGRYLLNKFSLTK